jgi:translocation and assembly module TamB
MEELEGLPDAVDETPPEPPPPRRPARRRPGRFRRWLVRPIAWLLFLVLLLLSAAVWYLYRPAVQRQLLERLIPRIEEYLGRDIQVGHIHYNLFPLWLELRDVSVGGPRPGDRPILTARRLYVLAELTSLRKPVIRLQEVRAEGVVAYLHRFGDNSDNWPRPKRRRRSGERPWELDITSFTVSDGLFRFEDEAVEVDLTASHIRVALLGMGGTDLQGRVICEQVDLQLPNANPYRAAVAGKIAVHREYLEILAARATSPDATIGGTGTVRWKGDKRVDLDISGSVSTDAFEKLGYVQGDLLDGYFQVDGKFEWTPGIWGFRGDARSSRLRALNWELTGVEGSIVGDRNAVWADVDHARYAGGSVAGWVEVTMPRGGRRSGGARNTRLELELEGVDAERFLDDSKIPVGDLASSLSGTLDFRFAETDWRRGSGAGELRLAARSRDGHGLPLAGSVPFVVDRGRVTTEAARLVGAGQTLTGAVRYAIATETGEIDYVVESTDLGPLAEAIPLAPARDGGTPLWLPTQGSGELSGTLSLAPRRVQTELRLALVDAVARGLSANRVDGIVGLSSDGLDRLQLELSRGDSAALIAGAIPYATGSPWTLDLDVARWPAEDALPWLTFPLPVSGPFTGSVTLGGAGASTHGTVAGEAAPAAVYDVPLDALRTQLAWDDDALRVADLTLVAPAGEVRVAGDMAFPGHELAMTVAASDLDLARAPFSGLGGGLAGVASFAGELSGTLEHPGLAGDLVAERLALDGRQLGESGRAALRVDWAADQLRASGSLLGLVRLDGGGFLDLDRMELSFAVEADDLATLAALGPEGLPEITGTARGDLAVVGSWEAPDLALRLDTLHTTVGGTPLFAGEPVRLRLSDARLWLDSLYLRDESGATELIAAGSAGLAPGEPLDLRLQGTVDNAWLAPWLPGFAISGISDVLATVRGTAGAPRVNGQASVRGGARLTSEALPEPIDDVAATVLFYPDRLVIDSMTGKMGGGTVQASGALDWPAANEALDARFQIAARDVSLRWPEGWLMQGDGDLVWTIAGEEQLLRGLVTLDRAAYVRDVELGFVQLLERFFRRQRTEVGVADEDLAKVQLNLQVRAPGTVRIRNNLADLRATAELTVRGSVARPLVFGEVEAEPGGRLVYADNTYRVERGALTFANPYRIEPLLDLEATTRVASYDVRLSLFGGLDRLNATFSSDPPLPDLEVLSLLLSGAPGRFGDDERTQLGRADDDQMSTAGAEGLLLGQAASLLTDRVSNLFGFDAFRVEPLSRSGESVSSARVTVGKRLSSEVYLTYSYDPSSTGGQRFQVEWQASEGFLVLLTQEQDSYAVDVLWEKRF